MRKFVLFYCIFALSSVSVFGNSESAPDLESSHKESREGYFTLTWKADCQGGCFLYEKNEKGNWTLIYSGEEKSRSITGQPEGTYQYKLCSGREESANCSGVVTVSVRHFSLFYSFLAFGLGAILFLVLVAFVLVGHRKFKEA